MTLTEFFELLRPGVELSIALLNMPVFGVSVWQHLLGLLLFSFVIGFIVKGTVFNGGFIPAVNRGLEPSGEVSNVGVMAHSDAMLPSYSATDSAPMLDGNSDPNRIYVTDYEVH